MVEYGGGISDGPAGQVSGGSQPFGQPVDLFSSVGHAINDAVNTVSALSPLEMLALGAVVLVGLILLRRAF